MIKRLGFLSRSILAGFVLFTILSSSTQVQSQKEDQNNDHPQSISNVQSNNSGQAFDKPITPYYYYYGNKAILLVPKTDEIVIGYKNQILAKQGIQSLRANGINVSVTYTSSTETYFERLKLDGVLSLGSFENQVKALNSLSDVKFVSPLFTVGSGLLYYTDEILISFKPEVTDQQVLELLDSNGLEQMIEMIPYPDGGRDLQVRIKDSIAVDTLTLANSLSRNNYIEHATPNFVFTTALESRNLGETDHPNPTSTSSDVNWHLATIRAREAWGLLNGKTPYSVDIAVIDEGVMRSHEDLQGVISSIGYDATTDSDTSKDPKAGEPKGKCSHGTEVAGVIAALPSNGDAMPAIGVGNNFLRIVPVNQSNEQCEIVLAGIVRGIRWAADHASVLNLSFGAYGNSSNFSEVDGALNYAFQLGKVIVVASGNDSVNELEYPANDPRVIAVGATDTNDQRKKCDICKKGKDITDYLGWGSNYGRELDLVAPGQDIKTTNSYYGIIPLNKYASPSGTSFSAPQVAATVGLMLVAKPNLRTNEIIDILHKTANNLVGGYTYDQNSWNEQMGFGRLDVYEAVSAVMSQNNPLLDFRILLERVQGLNHSTDVSIAVFDNVVGFSGKPTLRYTATMRSDSSGYSADSLAIPNIATGDYFVCAKPKYYLFRCKTVHLTNGQTTFIDYTDNGYIFTAGDINPGGQDGVINATDVEILRQRMNTCAHQPTISTYCAPLDLDRSGQVNSLDFAIMVIHSEKNLTSATNLFEKNIQDFWRPFPETIAATQEKIPTAVTGTAGVTLYSSGDYPMVGGNTGVGVLLDLSQTTSGMGSSNLIIHYDPGVWEVIDNNPNVAGIQVAIWKDAFPNAREGLVDPVKGEINFGVFQDWSSTGGLKIKSTLATIGFHCIAGTNKTEVWAEWKLNSTVDSVIAEYSTGNNLMGTVKNYQTDISGLPYRIKPGVTVNLPNGNFVGTYSVPITANVSDPYNQVKSVEFDVFYDGYLRILSLDTNSVDGWSYTWDSSSVTDQIIYFCAIAYLPGDTFGYDCPDNIILDRTKPNFVSHMETPAKPAWPGIVNLSATASDNLSGVNKIEYYVNSAKDGSTNGDWINVGTSSGSSGSINWQTSGFEKGLHRIAYAIQDNAGNWNRWDDPALPVITYGQADTYIPVIAKDYNSPRTLTAKALAGDGEIIKTGCTTWSSCRTSTIGNSTYTISNLATIASDYSSGSYQIKRIFLFFDTTQLPANATVTKVELNFYAGPYQTNGIKTFIMASTALYRLTNQDFGNISSVQPFGSVDPLANSWTKLTLSSSANSLIAKHGITKYALIHSSDFLDQPPTTQNNLVVAMSENTGYAPYLVVSYTLP